MEAVLPYRNRIREILAGADLEVVSAKTIRLQLEQEFNVDLSAHKTAIKQLTFELLESVPAGAALETPNTTPAVAANQPSQSSLSSQSPPKPASPAAPPPAKRRASEASRGAAKSRRTAISDEIIDDDSEGDDNDAPQRTARRPKASAKATVSARKRATGGGVGGLMQEMKLSDALRDVLGVDKMSRTEVVKFLWAYIREHNLQDPSDKRFILCDDALKAVFNGESRVSGFGMNKYLSQHLIKLEGASGPSPAKKPKATAAKGSGAGSGRGFNKPMMLSPALSAVLDVTELSRPGVVKALWAYIKKHDLQDPKDRRFILCDDKLKAVFGKDRVNAFGMNKFLSNHVYYRDDVVSAADIASDEDESSDGESSAQDTDDDLTAPDYSSSPPKEQRETQHAPHHHLASSILPSQSTSSLSDSVISQE